MADAHFLGAHRTRGQEDLWRRAMRVFLKEVMLDCPHRIEAEFIGERDLFEAIIEDALFGFAVPWTRHRNFVEDSKFHGLTSTLRRFIAIARRLKGEFVLQKNILGLAVGLATGQPPIKKKRRVVQEHETLAFWTLKPHEVSDFPLVKDAGFY